MSITPFGNFGNITQQLFGNTLSGISPFGAGSISPLLGGAGGTSSLLSPLSQGQYGGGQGSSLPLEMLQLMMQMMSLLVGLMSNQSGGVALPQGGGGQGTPPVGVNNRPVALVPTGQGSTGY